MRALILSCERVQTHSRVPINDLEGFQGTPVPHRGGTGGASLTTGVGHARPTQQIRQITLLRKCGHAKSFDFIRWARELRSSPERPCELKDHPQTVTYYPTDLHPMSHHSDGPPCATCITHSALAGPTRTCATSREASRSSATARARADATQRALARAASLHQRPRSAGPQWRRQKRQLSRRASRERAEPRRLG